MLLTRVQLPSELEAGERRARLPMLDSARRECLDRLLITGGRHLRLALTECTVRQPHRALRHSPLAGRAGRCPARKLGLVL